MVLDIRIFLKLLLFLIILLNQDHRVTCGNSAYEFLFDKLGAVKAAITNTHAAIQTTIEKALTRTKSPKTTAKPHGDFSEFFQNHPQNALNGVPDMNLMSIFFSKTTHTVTTPQLAATHGRVIETHVTFTLDGYILTLHRLRPNKVKFNNETPMGTVLLHHGLLGSSADWILLGPSKSLPYILSDAGYDVWLANARGNFYSRAHVSLNINSDEFWNFSWQDIGEYDLPATLEYIRKASNAIKPIDYIGYSTGATALLVLLSVEHSYNDYFRMAVLLAPLAFMAHTQGPMKKLATKNDTELTALLGKRDFMPARVITSTLSSKMCKEIDMYCKNPLFFLTGKTLQEGTCTTEFTELLQEYVPAGGSTKTIRHYLELISSKKFHHYGRPDWKFNIKFISVPMIIVSSSDDIISNPTDNQILYHYITSPVVHIVIADQNFSHTEFAWGYNADVQVYNKIRSLLKLGPGVIKGEGSSTRIYSEYDQM